MNPQVYFIYLFTSLRYEYGQSDELGYNAFMCTLCAIDSKIWEKRNFGNGYNI